MIRGLAKLRTLVRALPVVLAMLMAWPAMAVEPEEMLSDPALEERAREISKELRCLVCRNESIDDSHAALAKDLRLLVRERLVAGDTNDEVRAYLVDRFGEFVLLKPRFSLANSILWFAGPVLFVLGLIAAITYIRRRNPALAEASAPRLSAEEQVELDRILKE